MRDCLGYFQVWADKLGLADVGLDAAGNFHASLRGTGSKRLIIGSHLDSVPKAGAFDGVLGVVLGMLLIEWFQRQPPPCTIEVIGFSEEEGVRFQRPFIGSIAFVKGLDSELAGLLDRDGVSVAQAVEKFGLDPVELAQPQMEQADAYLEFHIEQGPVLESLGLSLGIVEAIVGQTRSVVEFEGRANHAGTTPMHLRHDAVCAAAEWVLAVEQAARLKRDLVATVGNLRVSPGANNIVPGRVTASLDLRHPSDTVKALAYESLIKAAEQIGLRRGVAVQSVVRLNQPAVMMDGDLTGALEQAFAKAGAKPHLMTSGAGHDAMVVAERLPAAMIFLRSPGGVSHHPDENVLLEDIAAALRVGQAFVQDFS